MLKARVQRIAAQVQAIPAAHIWIPAAKEIENYLPGAVLGKVFEIEGIPDPGQYEMFFPSEDANKKGTSFVESHLKRKGVDKMNLAVQAVPHMTKEIMEKRFDLAGQIGLILDKIRRWNS